MKLLKKKQLYIAVALLALAVVLVLFSAVHARYVSTQSIEENQVIAENFYFTTDLFTNSDETHRVIDVYGAADIPFAVMNYMDDKRINSTDIQYTIRWQKSFVNEEVASVKLGEEKLTESLLNYATLTGNAKNANVYTLSLKEGFRDGDKITVTVESTTASRYVKTMVLEFVLHSFKSEIAYYIEDDPVCTKLIVTSNKNIPANSILIDWSDVNTVDAGNILQIDCNNEYLLDGTVLSEKNMPGEELGYLTQCYITKDISTMQSFIIVFYKMPQGGKSFTCIGGTYEEQIGLDASVVEGVDYTYKIEIKKGGTTE